MGASIIDGKALAAATKAEAAALCGKLKAAGGSCFTARK